MQSCYQVVYRVRVLMVWHKLAQSRRVNSKRDLGDFIPETRQVRVQASTSLKESAAKEYAMPLRICLPGTRPAGSPDRQLGTGVELRTPTTTW